jgi:DNA transformation protein
MFGGAGVYRDGLMFALLAGGEIFLKSDAETKPSFTEAGSHPFMHEGRGGRRVETSYWSLPEAALDDGDVLRIWAERAYAAALRVRKPRTRRRVSGRPASGPKPLR